MTKEINVKDLSREQLETIATAVLNKDKLKELLKRAMKSSAEKSKLVGIKDIK